ncbi:MAG: hypothetical protein IT290_03020 [Deltaproteobacteria bacterium]|nr:hypothetical protein [Deltaproteobacteria bacterium]
MAEQENLALFLATRQKRLKYLRASFKQSSLPEDQSREVSERFSTYGLLLSKVAKAQTDPEREEAKARLLTLDRELTYLFEQRRLKTSAFTPTDRSQTIVMKPR